MASSISLLLDGRKLKMPICIHLCDWLCAKANVILLYVPFITSNASNIRSYLFSIVKQIMKHKVEKLLAIWRLESSSKLYAKLTLSISIFTPAISPGWVIPYSLNDSIITPITMATSNSLGNFPVLRLSSHHSSWLNLSTPKSSIRQQNHSFRKSILSTLILPPRGAALTGPGVSHPASQPAWESPEECRMSSYHTAAAPCLDDLATSVRWLVTKWNSVVVMARPFSLRRVAQWW